MELKNLKIVLGFTSLFVLSLQGNAQTKDARANNQGSENSFKQSPDSLVQIKNPQPSPGVSEAIPTPIQQGFEMQVINGQTIYKKTVGNVTIEYKPQ